jgi:hypothetical protein
MVCADRTAAASASPGDWRVGGRAQEGLVHAEHVTFVFRPAPEEPQGDPAESSLPCFNCARYALYVCYAIYVI